MTADVDTPPSPDALRPEVSSEEVDALLGVPATPPAVVPFPLGAAEKAAPGRMPAFDRLNERWVKEFGRELAERLRKPLEAAVHPVQLMPFADWQASVAAPAGLVVCTVPQWSRSVIIAVDGELLFVLVDGYFGGAGASGAKRVRSALSRAEQRLARLIAELHARLFQAAFEPLAKIELALTASEENPEYLAAARPAETVAVVRIDVGLNGQGGAVTLIVPQSCLEPLRERLVKGPRSDGVAPPGRWRDALAARLEAAEVELVSVLLETEISVRDLLRLKPGDVLPVDLPSVATLYAGDEPLLAGRFGVSQGANAISVTATVSRAAKRERTPPR